MTSSERELTEDLIFDILSSSRRRYVLYCLQEADEPMEVTDLAEQIAAWENDTEVSELSAQERKRVYVSLYQTHVPKLASAGVVEYDEDAGTVILGENARIINEYLRESPREAAWHWIYLGLALVGGLLILFASLNVSVYGLTPGLVVAGFLLASIVYYFFYRRRNRTPPDELGRRR